MEMKDILNLEKFQVRISVFVHMDFLGLFQTTGFFSLTLHDFIDFISLRIFVKIESENLGNCFMSFVFTDSDPTTVVQV